MTAVASAFSEGIVIESNSINDDDQALINAVRTCNRPVIRELVESGAADLDAVDTSGKSALYYALAYKLWDVAKFLMVHGADKDEPFNSARATYLYYACEKNEFEMAKLLLEMGADKEAKHSSGATPLWIACQNRNVELARLMIQNGARVDAAIGLGATPLYIACQNGALEIVELLSSSGANLEFKATGHHGNQPLHVAVFMGRPEVVQFLIAADVDIFAKRTDGKTPVEVPMNAGGSKDNYLAAVDVLKTEIASRVARELKRGSFKEAAQIASMPGFSRDYLAPMLGDWNEGEKVLLDAAKEGDIALVRLMINGVGVTIESRDSEYGGTPLYWACAYGKADVARFLIGKGADVNAEDSNQCSVLYACVFNNRAASVKVLFESGMDVENKVMNGVSGNKPLHVAVQHGNLEVAQTLVIECKVDVNLKNYDLQTAADIPKSDRADASKYVACIQFLKVKQIEILIRTKKFKDAMEAAKSKDLDLSVIPAMMDDWEEGGMCLIRAVRQGDLDLVKFLVETVHVSVESKDEDYEGTPLYWASREGRLNEAKYLISKGADLEARNTNEVSSLYSASYYGHAEAVKLLVQSGAQLESSPSSGETPLFVASERGHTAAAQVLIDAGANVEAMSAQGATPAYVAAQWGHLEVLKLLHAKGADLGHVADGVNKSTPLMAAVRYGQLNVCKFLVEEAQVDVRARRPDGKRAYDMFKADSVPVDENDYEACVKYVRSKMAASLMAKRDEAYALAEQKELELKRIATEKGTAVGIPDSPTPPPPEDDDEDDDGSMRSAKSAHLESTDGSTRG